MQFQCQPITLLAKRDLPTHPRAQSDLCIARRHALGQRLRRVVRDVEHRLYELLPIAAELGDRGVVVSHHTQALGKLGHDQRTHALADLMDVHVTHHMRAAVRCEQTVHQRLQAVGLVDDDLRVFGELLVVELQLQELRRPADATERVLDLVGQVADQFLVGLRLIDQTLLAFLARLLLQRQQLDDDLAPVLGLRHHHMHRQRLVSRALEPGVVTQGGELVVAGTIERVLQQRWLGKAILQQSAGDAASGHTQRVLQRRVGVEHGTVRVDHGHEGGQQIKGLKALRERPVAGLRRVFWGVALGGRESGGGFGLFQAAYFAAVPVPVEPPKRPNSRWILDTSLSARATAAFSSATRSR